MNNELKIMNPKVSIGFTTIVGILFAVAQYLGAIGTLLADTVTPDSIALLATATATLIATINHRTKQAEAAIHAAGAESASHPAVLGTPVIPRESVQTPETNVLYLDGDKLAREVVKALNTAALLQRMRTETTSAPAAATVDTGEASV